jgi:hypothetical protein
MAASNTRTRTPEEVRADIERERERLAVAVESLREGIGEVTDVAGKLRAKLPIVAAGALGTGFVLAGGIGATLRLLARRGREGKTKARVGRFKLVDRR